MHACPFNDGQCAPKRARVYIPVSSHPTILMRSILEEKDAKITPENNPFPELKKVSNKKFLNENLIKLKSIHST